MKAFVINRKPFEKLQLTFELVDAIPYLTPSIVA